MTKYPIVCMNETHKRNVKYKAKQMNIEIPEPITGVELLDKKLDKTPQTVLVDEALYVLSNILGGVRIDTASLTEYESKESITVRDYSGNDLLTIDNM